MPRLVRAKTPLPEGAAQAVSILGLNPLRAEVLRYLFLHPEGASSGDIGTAVGTNHRTVHNHLIQLEEQGIVSTHDGKERRAGQRVLYVANIESFDRATADLIEYIKGLEGGVAIDSANEPPTT